jgi:hypothetical protein
LNRMLNVCMSIDIQTVVSCGNKRMAQTIELIKKDQYMNVVV